MNLRVSAGLRCQYLQSCSSVCTSSPPALRYSSTTTSPSPPPTKAPSKVNGPISTLPAPLALPVRAKDQPFFPAYALALGKAYLAFYKTGVKHIYTNFKAARAVQKHLDDAHASSLKAAVDAGALTRSDFQLLVRNWHDVKRVPVFALVFAVCGELTPLVVVAVSSIVPWTCRIPKQIESDRRRLETRRAISFRNLTSAPPEKGGVDGLGRMELLHISWSLGLSSNLWDWLGGRLPGLPTWVLRRRVARRVEYLKMDDELIRNSGGVKEMEDEECRMACVERGIDVLGRSDKQVRADLEAWLKSSQMVSVERLLLTR
jgi:hypothetical protein